MPSEPDQSPPESDGSGRDAMLPMMILPITPDEEGTMGADNLRPVFHRELETLRAQLRAYPDETAIWKRPPGLPNSAGNLALHLCGNLQHFVGAVLGHTGYQRDRDREFAARDVSRDDLEAQIDAAQRALRAGLETRTSGGAESDYPAEFGGSRLPTLVVLGRLLTHFGYHLGQIDIHRRLSTGQGQGIEEPPISMLAE